MFSPGVERALRIAVEAHAGQVRKGDGETPYVTHPMHVALLLTRGDAGLSQPSHPLESRPAGVALRQQFDIRYDFFEVLPGFLQLIYGRIGLR